MKQKTYNFQNPEVQHKATQKARISKRPKTYLSKRRRIEEVKRKLISEELLRGDFIQQVGAVMPQITEAMIVSALQPTSVGSSDRRIIYTALKIIAKEREVEPQETMGQIIADLMKT